ncbi:hypothetical protein M0812_11176 [Anaeramoeba flamelloides]|uniref:Uncharacterized protein n=1 Tax=Anaeramoeba flamelloides TaxID=1746091 RepID=A0AAV7ZTM7_9EUKA|nr:hypothetical protein M0812_11176 [Anaeramoeba flamelloides]
MEEQKCPICKKNVEISPRYPHYVCGECRSTGVFTKEGKQINFFNEDMSGGFLSQIEGEKKFGREHTCYIKNVKCFADEARFGGIVIQVSKPLEEK